MADRVKQDSETMALKLVDIDTVINGIRSQVRDNKLHHTTETNKLKDSVHKTFVPNKTFVEQINLTNANAMKNLYAEPKSSV